MLSDPIADVMAISGSFPDLLTNNKYMENKIYRKKDKIIIEIPFYNERSNPYDQSFHEQMNNIVGLICPEKGCSEPEMGFSKNIDMSYKGKPDQETDFFYKYWGKKEDFIKLCKDLEIEVREIPACAYCGAPLFGCFTVGEKGDMCDECEIKQKS